MQQCERLRRYNRWRRGDKRLKIPDPKELGELIDGVADRLEVLEREHTEFFDRWHGERRKREKLAHDVERCYRMLLSEPDTKGALFKAENILREALAEQKVGSGGTATEGHNALGEGRERGILREASSGEAATSTDGLDVVPVYELTDEQRNALLPAKPNKPQAKNVFAFPATTTMTPEQALLSALEFAKNDNMQDVLVVGYDGDGYLLVRSSRMDRKEALWLSEQLRKYALGDGA